MKSAWLVGVVVAVALHSSYALVACSSSTADLADASVADSATADARTGTDAGNPTGNDAGPSGDAGGVDSSCEKASDCNGDVCCGTIPITGGTVPNCTTGTLTTVCTAASACATKLGTSCSGTQTVRLCTTNKDCTESGDSSCCTFGDADGGSLSFCANAFVGAFGGGKCQ